MLRQPGRVQVRAAVIGHPVDHSSSPALHLRAYQLLGLPIEYTRIDATAPDAGALADRLRHEPGWLGLSVTMPMKQPMIQQVDVVHPLAAALGALNTVVVERAEDAPVLHGHNTDVAGIVAALRAAGVDSCPTSAARLELPPRALVIGAGGTAAAALAALHDLGHVHVAVAVRAYDRVHELPRVAAALGMHVDFIDFESLTTADLGIMDVVVSTLPAGAADPLAPVISALAAPGSALLDAAYAQWPSVLSTAWGAAGGTPVHGLAMLVHQAVEQVALFTGRAEALGQDYRDALCDEVGITRDGTAATAVAG
ncbi:MAG: shikimate dehydrogenase family protein [Galactobacter sp.]